MLYLKTLPAVLLNRSVALADLLASSALGFSGSCHAYQACGATHSCLQVR